MIWFYNNHKDPIGILCKSMEECFVHSLEVLHLLPRFDQNVPCGDYMQISSDTTYLFWIYIFLGTSQRSKGCSKINWQSKASTKTKIWSKYARKNATFIIKNAKINQKVWHFKELLSVLIFPRLKSQVKKGSKRSTGCSKIEFEGPTPRSKFDSNMLE